jgi:hypothetical protein
MGANMDSTDTQQSEKGHKAFVKTSYQVCFLLYRELAPYLPTISFLIEGIIKAGIYSSNRDV